MLSDLCFRVQKTNVESPTYRCDFSDAITSLIARVNLSPQFAQVGATSDAPSPYDSNASAFAEMIDVPEDWPPRMPFTFACNRERTGRSWPHTMHCMIRAPDASGSL